MGLQRALGSDLANRIVSSADDLPISSNISSSLITTVTNNQLSPACRIRGRRTRI